MKQPDYSQMIEQVRSQMSSNFTKVFEKLDDIKDEKYKEHKEIGEKITGVVVRINTLETERSAFGTAFARTMALIGGLGGIYALGERFFGKHQ